MRKSRFTKVVAVTTAATMMLTPMAAFATETGGGTSSTSTDVTDPASASGSTSGDGSLEGYVNKKVFRVVLPTISDVNFTLDPQGLLNKADSTKYAQTTGAVYFENAATTTGGTATYSAKSDAIKFINKSSYDVDVSLSVALNAGDVALVKQADLSSATVPSLYLGLEKGSDPAVAIESASYESTPATIDKVPEADGTTVTKGYQITASSSAIEGVDPSPNGYYYTYALTSGFADTDAEDVSYKLTGACDAKADWSEIDTTAVTATITWSITEAGLPRITGSAYSRARLNNTYTLANVTEDIKSIDISTDGTTVALQVPTTAYSVSSDKSTLTIDGTKAGIGAAADGKVRYFIVTFADNTKLAFSVNVTNSGEFAYSCKNTANTYTLAGNNQTIKSMVISVDGSTSAATVPTEAYSLGDTDKTALTVDGTKAGIGEVAVGAVRYLIITFADDSKTTLCLNVSA